MAAEKCGVFMARSGNKQGNRRHRAKLKGPDGKIVYDQNGFPVTVGLASRPFGSLRGNRKRAAAHAAFATARASKMAEETARQSLWSRINSRP